jgi:hypothetical protein
MMEKGHRPEENHVSRTSSSWCSVNLAPAASFVARSVASCSVRPTTHHLPSFRCGTVVSPTEYEYEDNAQRLTSCSVPSRSTKYAGHRCPHHNCLEMHQSWIPSSQRYHSASEVFGAIDSSPALVRYQNFIMRRETEGVFELTLTASSARGLQSTHHWGFMTGSMISPDLLQINRYVNMRCDPERRKEHTCRWGHSWDYPSARRTTPTPSKPQLPLASHGIASYPAPAIIVNRPSTQKLKIQRTLNFSPAFKLNVPSSLRILINSRLCRTPTS